MQEDKPPSQVIWPTCCKQDVCSAPRRKQVSMSCLKKLNDAISHSAAYEHIFVCHNAPSDRQEKYLYVQQLHMGLCRPCVLCTYSIGGLVGNYLFV